MHELGLAQSILAIVEEYVPEEQAASVRTIKVRVGTFAGVVADSLEFCFGAIVSGTPWGSARLDIVPVPASAVCRKCRGEFEIDDPVFLCPSCGGSDVQLASGMELQVAEIELDDKAAEAL